MTEQIILYAAITIVTYAAMDTLNLLRPSVRKLRRQNDAARRSLRRALRFITTETERYTKICEENDALTIKNERLTQNLANASRDIASTTAIAEARGATIVALRTVGKKVETAYVDYRDARDDVGTDDEPYADDLHYRIDDLRYELKGVTDGDTSNDG